MARPSRDEQFLSECKDIATGGEAASSLSGGSGERFKFVDGTEPGYFDKHSGRAWGLQDCGQFYATKLNQGLPPNATIVSTQLHGRRLFPALQSLPPSCIGPKSLRAGAHQFAYCASSWQWVEFCCRLCKSRCAPHPLRFFAIALGFKKLRLKINCRVSVC
jgi:hypothetical protein